MSSIPASSFVPAASTLANTDFPRSLSVSLTGAPTVAGVKSSGAGSDQQPTARIFW